MKPRADLTPYPILMAANDDYIGASFHAETSIQAISNKYAMNCEFTLDEPTIESLLIQNPYRMPAHFLPNDLKNQGEIRPDACPFRFRLGIPRDMHIYHLRYSP